MSLKRMSLALILVVMATGCSSMSHRTECMVKGALLGATIGGATGGMITNNTSSGHASRGLAIGGAAGALVGGTIGFIVCAPEEVEPVPEPMPAPAPAPKPEPVAEPAPVVAPAPVAKIVLNAIRFQFDSAQIQDQYTPVLDAGIAELQQYPDRMVTITGHTCAMGPEQYNQGLSERRAAAVMQYLVDHGIAADRLQTQGAGETQPIADNTTLDGRRMNRRVEFIVE